MVVPVQRVVQKTFFRSQAATMSGQGGSGTYVNAPPVWTTVPTISYTQGVGGDIPVTVTDPNPGEVVTVAVQSGAGLTGITFIPASKLYRYDGIGAGGSSDNNVLRATDNGSPPLFTDSNGHRLEIIVPQQPTGDLVWTSSATIVIAQGGTYPLANNVQNLTGDPAFYAYDGPYGGLSGRSITLDRTTGVLAAAANSPVATSTAVNDFDVVTARWLAMSDAGQTSFEDAASQLEEGATWMLATRWSGESWQSPGGDWFDKNNATNGGTTHSTISVADASMGLKTYTFPLDLLAKLRSKNHGILMRGAASGKGTPAFEAWYMSNWPGVANPAAPVLTVNVGATVFNCPCTVSIGLDPTATDPSPIGPRPTGRGSGYPPGQPLVEIMHWFWFPAILKFDLSSIVGTPTSATLKLTRYAAPDSTAASYPFDIKLDYVRPPQMRRHTPAEIGTVVEGIASTVATDQALASHSSVIFYQECSSANFNDFNPSLVPRKWTIPGFWGASDFLSSGGHEFITWPEYGMGAVRCHGGPSSQRMTAWWGTGITNLPFAGNERLFIRYGIRFDPNADTAQQQGIKLPGPSMDETRTLDPGVSFSYRTWHSPPSTSNPLIRRWGLYVYDLQTAGDIRYTSAYQEPDFDAAENPIHWVEQEHWINDPGVPNGASRLWVDGVLVHQNQAAYITSVTPTRIFAIPFINVYHGGMPFPIGPYWVEISGICMARQYIGPPKKIA